MCVKMNDEAAIKNCIAVMQRESENLKFLQQYNTNTVVRSTKYGLVYKVYKGLPKLKHTSHKNIIS